MNHAEETPSATPGPAATAATGPRSPPKPETPARVICDVGGVVSPDLTTLDALARLQLAAGRLGRKILLRNPCEELRDLLALTGLSDELPTHLDSGAEARGQAEVGEESLGVEEEGDPTDPIA
jgi:hypothetical protein